MTRRKAPGTLLKSGRKTIDPGGEHTRRQEITMPPRYWERARALDPAGKGNASAGVRAALDAAK